MPPIVPDTLECTAVETVGRPAARQLFQKEKIMRLRWIMTCVVFGSIVTVGALLAQQPSKSGPAEGVAPHAAINGNFKTFKEQSSYAIGIDIGRGMKSQGVDVDSAMLAKGIADA